MSFPIFDTIIGGVKGSVMGLMAGASVGGVPGAIVGAIIGGVAGNVEGYYEGTAKNELEEKGVEAAKAQGIATDSSGRRATAAMIEQSAAQPTGTSSTMFKKAQLQETAQNNYAATTDKYNQFQPVDDKGTKLAQNYGKPVSVSKAA